MNMTARTAPYLTAVLANCALLSSCVTMVDGVPTTENEIRTIRQASVVHGAAGAALGALASGGVAALSGASDEGILYAALGGAVVGGGLGVQQGQKKGVNAVREKRYVKLEKTRLDSLLQQANQTNQEFAAYNQRLRGTISTLRGEQKNLSSSSLQSAYNRRVQAETKGAYYARQQLTNYISEGSKLVDELDPSQAGAYEAQINKAETQLASVNQAIKELQALDERVAVDTRG